MLIPRTSRWHALLAAFLLLNTITAAEKPEAAAASAPETHAVTRGALKLKVQLDGVFEAVEMTPVRIAPRVWTDLTVLEPVAHGAKVKKGDRLVKLDTEKLEDQIADLEQDQLNAAIAIELAALDLNNAKATNPLKLESASHARQVANEDYDYFQAVARTEREKAVLFSVTNAMNNLANAREELTQLEKMYKADHLTEETEEIILKRQQFAVEAAEFHLASAKLRAERDLKVNLPREHIKLQLTKREQESAFAFAEATLAPTLSKKELDLAKMKRDQTKSVKKGADLKRDLAALQVTAPVDGTVYYGVCHNGKWTTAAELAKKLVPGGKLAAHEVVMTVVNTDKLIVRATVPETELQHLRVGLKGEATPTVRPDRKLPATVNDLSFIPLPGGGFEARLELERTKSEPLAPGMNCKVTFENIERKDVLLIPKAAVFTDNNEKVIYLALADGKSERRVVKAGASNDTETEILEGVSEGDKVLLKRPE